MKILHISTFLPTKCGIATYTADLISHLTEVQPLCLRMSYGDQDSPGSFWRSVAIEAADEYEAAIIAINQSDADVVSLQHEFEIFGGPDGKFVTHFGMRCKKPIVTTLHTVTPHLSPRQRAILRSLVNRSRQIVVMTEESSGLLKAQFEAPADKVQVIRHGIPDVKFTQPSENPLRASLQCDLVFISAGLLRPSKGYGTALSALSRFREVGVPFRYLILGTSSSQLDSSGILPQQLRSQIANAGLEKEVIRIDRYLEDGELLNYIQAADLGLVTYTVPDQASSGILPMLLGCGRPVVATDFAAARSAAGEVDGVFLASVNDPESVCAQIQKATGDRARLHRTMRSNYLQTRSWLWKDAAERYRGVFQQALRAAGGDVTQGTESRR